MTTDSKHLFAFTDRPDRRFASLTFSAWAQIWKEGANSFEKDPPNAVLVGTSLEDETKQVLVEIELLSPPEKIDGGYSFRIKRVDEVQAHSVIVKQASLAVDGYIERSGRIGCVYAPPACL